MKIAVIIQARMSSKRLPKKVLKNINEKPLLEYIIEQIQYNNHNIPIIVATSREKSDHEIVNYCKQKKILFHQGDLLNVASRFIEIINLFKLDFFVRVCADSPLLDGNLIKKAVQLINKNIDLVTNINPRTFPKGQSVEVINSKIFIEAYLKFKTNAHREHVTKYFYENASEYKIKNIENNVDLSNLSLAIDSKKDFQNIENIIYKMTKPHFQYNFKDLLQLNEL